MFRPTVLWPIILVVFISIPSIAFGQSHYLGLNTVFTLNEKDFYTSPTQTRFEIFTEELSESSIWKYGFGAEYRYILSGTSPWFLSSRLEYAYRSFSVTLNEGEEVISQGRHFDSQYLDILIGGGKNFSVSENTNVGFTFSPGLGVPLLKAFPGQDTLSDGVRNQFLTFVEIDANFEVIYSQKENHAWSIGISPFLRTYFSPLYERGSSDKAIFFGYGAVAKIGCHF